MKRITLTIATLLALVVPATASAWTGNVFKSPTGNLVCKYRGWTDTLTCGRWNDQRIVSMTSTGPAREGIRMTWYDEAPHTLYYGQKFTTPGLRFTCTSYFNGMRCINANGHGFFISRTVLNRW